MFVSLIFIADHSHSSHRGSYSVLCIRGNRRGGGRDQKKKEAFSPKADGGDKGSGGPSLGEVSGVGGGGCSSRSCRLFRSSAVNQE